MAKTEIKIFDIMACDVYWDFEESRMPKETHKFLVALYPTPGVVAPEMIKKIMGYGPGGYEVKFSNEKYNTDALNGWFYDPKVNNYWYMINLPTGFMKEGEYTIEVTCKDGTVVKKSRMQKSAPSQAMVSSYLKHRDQILDSFTPSRKNPLKPGAALKNIKCSWKTLKDVDNHDAFYVYRLAQCTKPKEFDGNQLVWFDNIYTQRLFQNQPKAGLNRGEVVIETDLKPNTSYGYFVEITDGNIAGDANICIFQPHQFFKTS
ncbi:MAG TPA: hypothetical protein P5294_07450 [Smithellaceae bacterium]|nr:hypothetical protein [Smithellaceae bacterium]HRS89583.1 hypothetical protein [Smithellaceae bacterium]HRV26356.1 hypothetical protein [Smithellaceae bacterium]